MALSVVQALFLAVSEGEATLITQGGDVMELAKIGSGMSVTNENGAQFHVFPHFGKYQAITLDEEVEDVYDGEDSMDTICSDFFENILELSA